MACEERPPGLKDHCILYAEMLIDFWMNVYSKPTYNKATIMFSGAVVDR